MKHIDYEFIPLDPGSQPEAQVPEISNQLNYMTMMQGREIVNVQLTKSGFLVFYRVETKNPPAKEVTEKAIKSLEAILATQDVILEGWKTLSDDELHKLLVQIRDRLIKDIDDTKAEWASLFAPVTQTIKSKM